MSRPGLRGARRTRIYDSNYNASQNYYKPTLDNLDRKYYGRPLTTDRFESPKPTSLFSPSREARTPFDDTPLNDARRRAERVITNDDSFFDVRGARVPKSSIGETIREFDDEFKSTLSKIRANKTKVANFSDDIDFDDTVDSFKRRGRAAVSDFDSAVDDSFAKSGSSIKKSSYKLSSRREEETEPVAITKWSSLTATTDDSGASLRAKASKARLEDLESEMFERSEKQAAREKRSQALKKFIADIDNEISD
ncbi:uncharacterized protein LOC129574259 [Sitodiplosis mosellana]|uniref:uncharacterized protein LOC129574259 n=1 Tax=Sitodiplosis mosellana TaxID=263140 RepID=UPI00244465A7|nr:uncharacterized protein LOC129574259 [Sitodiplosis mosellana]XP_055312017.1 uncharacterized protein LOC129574259 [Sitodiplosis mosellana]XP_055312018.1 uncharacterized protein LOC129574259 [Sitodiplosis mosellana]